METGSHMPREIWLRHNTAQQFWGLMSVPIKPAPTRLRIIMSPSRGLPHLLIM
jgi:hypothetical protein